MELTHGIVQQSIVFEVTERRPMQTSAPDIRETRTKRPARTVSMAAASLAGLGFIGVMDYVTGPEISFGVFYFLPIWLITWKLGRRAGVQFSVVCALVWLAVDYAGGSQYSSPFIPYWNAATRLIYFLTFAIFLSDVRERLHRSRLEVKRLSSLLPICASCKNIRDEKGRWHEVEVYIKAHSDTNFSHGICPDCAKKFYPEFYDQLANKWKQDGG